MDLQSYKTELMNQGYVAYTTAFPNENTVQLKRHYRKSGLVLILSLIFFFPLAIVYLLMPAGEEVITLTEVNGHLFVNGKAYGASVDTRDNYTSKGMFQLIIILIITFGLCAVCVGVFLPIFF